MVGVNHCLMVMAQGQIDFSACNGNATPAETKLWRCYLQRGVAAMSDWQVGKAITASSSGWLVGGGLAEFAAVLPPHYGHAASLLAEPSDCQEAADGAKAGRGPSDVTAFPPFRALSSL
jgi:hypothetical protein